MSIDPNVVQCEEEAARLLPWFVAGSLAAADAERVMRHLEHCAICRADAEHERNVRLLLKSDARVEYAPQPGLSKTLERIDALVHGPTTALTRSRRLTPLRWLTAAVLIQAIGLGVLSTMWVHDRGGPSPRYGTLSMSVPVPTGIELRAVFAPGMTLGQLRALLAAQNLTIVRGPSDAGAYTLSGTGVGITPAQLANVLAALRRDPRALFVEPVYDGTRPAP